MIVTINGKEIHSRDDVYDALNHSGKYAEIEYHEMNRAQVDRFHTGCVNDVCTWTDVNGNTDTYTKYTVRIEDEGPLDGFYYSTEYFNEKAVQKICEYLIYDGFILNPTKNAKGVAIDFDKCEKIYKHFKYRYAQESLMKETKGIMLWTGSAREIEAALYTRKILEDITEEELANIYIKEV